MDVAVVTESSADDVESTVEPEVVDPQPVIKIMRTTNVAPKARPLGRAPKLQIARTALYGAENLVIADWFHLCGDAVRPRFHGQGALALPACALFQHVGTLLRVALQLLQLAGFPHG